jgi:hypothetical protein
VSHNETNHTFFPVNGLLPENTTVNLYIEQAGICRP